MDLLKYNQFQEFLNEQKEESYGSLSYEFDFPQLKVVHDAIDPKDLYKADSDAYGFCHKARILLLGKIKTNEIDEKDAIDFAKIDSKDEITLKNISVIEESDFDILKWDIDNSDIDSIKQSVKKIPHIKSNDPINVHSYIAYMKKGKAQQYVEAYEGRSFRIHIKHIVYKKGNGIEIKVSPK